MSAGSPPSAGNSAGLAALRHERDRFVALAFCAADILLEVDKAYTVSYAAGATRAILGRDPGDIEGLSFYDLIVAEDCPVVQEIVRTMTVGRRLQPVPINLKGADQGPIRLLLSGYILPHLEGSLFFALRIWNDDSGSGGASGLAEELEMSDPQTFSERVSRELSAARKAGEDVSLTMVRVEELGALKARIAGDADFRIGSAVGACLKAIGGRRQLIGRVDERNFGMVHGGEIDLDSVRAQIQNQLVALDPDGIGAEIAVGTASPDIPDITEDDLAKALHYTIRSFCEDEDPSAAIGKLAGNLQSGIATSSQRVTRFRQMVSAANFDVALQPIVRIATGQVKHFEALARFAGGSDRSPYELITFAENAGLICDFDYAMATKVLEFLTHQHRLGKTTSVAVNLSGNSVTNPPFVEDFFKLLARHEAVRPRLLVEITESARIKDISVANGFIQKLRRAGHTVCLDDFGAGAAALQYLHDIEVDIVKIDGQYIQSALSRHKSRALLRAIAGLCRELSIETVGEMIEDEATLAVVEDCGIDLGQGYLFGRPTIDIDAMLAEIEGSFSPVATASLSRQQGAAK